MPVKVEIIPESEAVRPVQFKGFVAEVHRALSRIGAGQVLRLTTDTTRTQGIGSSLGHYRKKSPFKVEYWAVDGVYYVKRLADGSATTSTPEPVKLPDPGRCPRCNGQLMRSREIDGMLVKCLACGFEPTETPEQAGIILDRERRRPPAHAGARL